MKIVTVTVDIMSLKRNNLEHILKVEINKLKIPK